MQFACSPQENQANVDHKRTVQSREDASWYQQPNHRFITGSTELTIAEPTHNGH